MLVKRFECASKYKMHENVFISMKKSVISEITSFETRFSGIIIWLFGVVDKYSS